MSREQRGGPPRFAAGDRVAALLAAAGEELRATGVGNPRFEAELLLAAALERPRIFLFTHPEYELTEAEQGRLAELLGRRLSGEPLQYVLGTAQFRHLWLRAEPGVLIPRAETEVLVEIAWAALERGRPRWQARGAALPGGPPVRFREPPAAADERPWVIDVGTGSGAIILALLDEARRAGTPPWFRPLATDLSARPLDLTHRNAVTNRLPPPELLQADLLAPIRPGAPVAAVVANPPYVSSAEMPALPYEIRLHEPHEALHGGPDGLAVVRTLVAQAAPFVRAGAVLCLEIGATQAGEVRALLDRHGLGGGAVVHPDLAGRPRVVCVDPPAPRG